MISKIIPANVLATDRQESEDTIRIACGVNNEGRCNLEGSSVAEQVSRKYCREFSDLGWERLGHIHTRNFDMQGIAAQVIGIVCNTLAEDASWEEDSSDWSSAVSSVRRGFEVIPTQITQTSINDDITRNLKSEAELTIKDSSELEIAMNLQNLLDNYRNTINPIIRSVLIGGGKSGFNNDANVAGILQAMHESSANIHLYLQAEQQMAQVAKVVPKFPEIGALAAIPGYEDIRLAA